MIPQRVRVTLLTYFDVGDLLKLRDSAPKDQAVIVGQSDAEHATCMCRNP